MNELSWEVLDWNVPVNFFGSNSKSLLWRHYGRDILIIQEDCSTVILEFASRNYVLSPPNIKVIQSKNNVINIFHVSEAIYMLDDSGDLFEFVCANNEWSWKWVQHLDKGLAITGLQNGLAFLRKIEKMTFIEIYDLKMSEFELHSSKKLNYCDISADSYQVINAKADSVKFFLKAAFKKIDVKEVLFIGDPSNFTYIFPVNKKLLPLNFEKESLLTILINEQQNCMLLVYASGKIVSIMCDQSIRTNVLYFPEKVHAITWFDDHKNSVLWSDGIELHLSKFPNFTEIVDLHINHNIKGVQHLVKVNEKILAVTSNGGFYSIQKSDEVLSNPPIIKKSGEVLKEIYDIGVFVEKLNEDIKSYEDLIYAVVTSKMENISKHIKVSIRGKELSIRNETGRVFKKNIWVLKLEVCDKNKRFVEIKNFENDFNEGSLINFETKLPIKKFLRVSLICDCGNNLSLIEINVREIETLQIEESNSVAEKLKELAQKKKNKIVK